MTRKGYELLARVIGEALAAAESREGLKNQLLYRLGAALRTDNPNFKEQKFLNRVDEVEAELQEK